MTTTNDALVDTVRNLRATMSGLSYKLNSAANPSILDLNQMRREAGAALNGLASIEALVMQQEEERNALRDELNNIGQNIMMLQEQLNPELISGLKWDTMPQHPINEPNSVEKDYAPSGYTAD